ncbi:VWA domain-containing protein [Candidatus Chloroploca asiatica]|uniref:VWA domain-containing protein n=1 Tax=Candidatus Chloroploca asiatica TaxID=1506545 RepID=A0A2H3KGI1_9CHLR|nr:VWA domain-containing protein [Candidatus Chloroploca asiatica]PDV96855.1 VWA domain-containing protein [Candidatus Chloroploca asiatica]
MSNVIQLEATLSRAVLPESTEPQLIYALLDMHALGGTAPLLKLSLNLCLVIDRSSSMRGERLQQVKEGVARIIDLLSEDDYFSLVTFNDRADVVVNTQRVRNKQELKQAVNRIEAAGGTEMATGMAMALQEVQKPVMLQGVSRILLLTDGRTYGDEGRCVELARRAQDRGIGVTAMGIGTEWNEDLLETIAARENSRTQYITSATQISQVFADEVKRMSSIFAQDLRFQVELRPGALLRSLDRVRPYLTSVPISEDHEHVWTASLGDWPNTEPQALLLEIVVPVLRLGDHPLLRLRITYNLPGLSLKDQQAQLVLRMSVRKADTVPYEVNATVKQWLERLVAYRLQANAWQQAEQGNATLASQRLQMAGSRLLEAGELDLARTVQEEATRLAESGEASAEGRKRIKYGTRGLMGSPDDTK